MTPVLGFLITQLHAKFEADYEPLEFTEEWLTLPVANLLATAWSLAHPASFPLPSGHSYQCHNHALDRMVLYPGSVAHLGFALDVHATAPTGYCW